MQELEKLRNIITDWKYYWTENITEFSTQNGPAGVWDYLGE